MTETFWIETLGCPKNQVDSDKLVGTMLADGLVAAPDVESADVVVVNTCAFIESARQESVDTILALSDRRRDGAKLVVTGCLAERSGPELAAALPEVDQVAGFGVPVTLGRSSSPDIAQSRRVPSLDLLELPRPPTDAAWAYVKVAEGCDRNCGFCAIPSFRGPQRSRTIDDIVREAESLGAPEIVLVAQDLARYGADRADIGYGSIVELVRRVAAVAQRVRLLYLYPSELNDELIDVIGSETGVPYYDLSLQHVSRPLVKRMRRYGDAGRFLDRIQTIRARYPTSALRSSFIVGYPGETEADHDQLLAFVRDAQLDWAGFFSYSREDGTYAADLDGVVPAPLMAERLAEVSALQDDITAMRRDLLVGTETTVLVDAPGVARSHREAPEIDGVILVDASLKPRSEHRVTIVESLGLDLRADLTAVTAKNCV